MKFIRCMAILLLVLYCGLAAAEVAVIVHPNNSAELSRNDIARIFLGQKTRFPNGNKAVPLVLDGPTAQAFYETVLHRSPNQMRAYWAQQIFTGKIVPPQVVQTQEMLDLVADWEEFIGFVDADDVTAQVRVIDRF